MSTHQCSICFDTFEHDSKKTIQLGCGHIYHGSCIMEWFKVNSTCPL